ncbi:choice-of-anchor V domain-containing protein [Parasediminibacterium sp. JCM 36343]|uniref:choice-of-anchor V domain-containing protein n=1 Tax=Parasediminibacterium sp. JCM 36343 TaxID=3374279 RepID=UPI00397B0FA3
MKKLSTILVLATLVVFLQSSVKRVYFSSQPPQGYTGASGNYCVDCHSSFPLNSGGGDVTVAGLPASGYVPGKTYDLALTITHGTADRKRWGFSITAVDQQGAALGTFTSTNANAQPNGAELSHFSAVKTTASKTFTYSNLHWTAPATGSAPVNFFFVGNAANSANGNQGDYIYSGSATIALPISLKDFTASAAGSSVQLAWQTTEEVNSNFFSVEKSDDGQIFYSIDKVFAKGNSSTLEQYSYTDDKPSFFGRAIFYRLKQVDKDGSFKYSKVVSVIMKATSFSVNKIYPTILKAGGLLTAQITSNKSENIQILLVDAGGKVIGRITKPIIAGTNTVSFNVNTTTKGMVYAKFISSTATQTIPFFVN